MCKNVFFYLLQRITISTHFAENIWYHTKVVFKAFSGRDSWMPHFRVAFKGPDSNILPRTEGIFLNFQDYLANTIESKIHVFIPVNSLIALMCYGLSSSELTHFTCYNVSTKWAFLFCETRASTEIWVYLLWRMVGFSLRFMYICRWEGPQWTTYEIEKMPWIKYLSELFIFINMQHLLLIRVDPESFTKITFCIFNITRQRKFI